MRLIESKVELLTQESGLQGIYKQIELAGRTCYKSENNITGNSAKEFVERMIKSGHTSMLEHGTVYLAVPYSEWDEVGDYFMSYPSNPYSKCDESEVEDFTSKEGTIYITTNLRVLVENDWLDDLKFLCEPTKVHERRISLKFTTDRGVSHELVRHRTFSFAQESTRYCNYNKNKFGNQLTFVMPNWYNSHKYDSYKMNEFDKTLSNAEELYMFYIQCGMSPQEARQVLPNALKTEIVMTGFISDWKHFFDLRYFGTTGMPHPDMLELTSKAKDILTDQGLWDIMTNKH